MNLHTTVLRDGKVFNSNRARRPARYILIIIKLSGERLKTNTALFAATSSSAFPVLSTGHLKNFYKYFLIAGIFIPVFKLRAQVTDTLEDIKIFSKRPLNITVSPVAVQQLNKITIAGLNSVSVADAVKYFSGVTVKDYGGIGGLKTVSVRSLGANHTGLMYDGIMTGDAQGGQIDLGRFSLDNIELVQLFNNQPPDVLLPARTFASAAVLSLSSASGKNDAQPATEFSVGIKAGSFGFVNPSVMIKIEPHKNFVEGLSGEYQAANGAYSFKDYETGNTKSKRNNSDIKTYRLEYDAAYIKNDSNSLKFKAYYYNSKRGLPGAVILYNDFSDKRLDNENFFSQLSWQKNISLKSRILISSKYTADNKYYLDPSYQNNAGGLENNFHQQEFYLSAAYSYSIFRNLAISYSSDYFKNILKRTDRFAQAFANPCRDNFLNNIAFQLKKKCLEINGNLLHTYITGKVERGPVANDLHKFTPAFSVLYRPFNNLPLRLRASYKNIFRAPTFDDLYYTNVGNTNLRPEYAKQYDVGITVGGQYHKFIKEIAFTTDAYYNKVTDKILAVPRQNLFQWTTLNIGKVSIKGLDVALHLYFVKWSGMDISLALSYTYQHALDISDPASLLYKTQLPYTPEHSGSININAGYRRLSFNYNILLSSYRYRIGEPGPENIVQGWATHDVSVSYRLASKKYWDYCFRAEANNIYDLQYEIVKYYPMPRFNYRLGIIMSFKKIYNHK